MKSHSGQSFDQIISGSTIRVLVALFVAAEEQRRFIGLQTTATLRSVLGTLNGTPAVL